MRWACSQNTTNTYNYFFNYYLGFIPKIYKLVFFGTPRIYNKRNRRIFYKIKLNWRFKKTSRNGKKWVINNEHDKIITIRGTKNLRAWKKWVINNQHDKTIIIRGTKDLTAKVRNKILKRLWKY